MPLPRIVCGLIGFKKRQSKRFQAHLIRIGSKQDDQVDKGFSKARLIWG